MLAQPASNEPDEEAETQSTAEQLKQKAGQYNQRASDLGEQLNNNPNGKSHEEALALQDQVTQLNADTQQLREDLNEAARSGEITGSDLPDALYDVDDAANRANNLRPEAARQVQYASPNGQNAREVAEYIVPGFGTLTDAKDIIQLFSTGQYGAAAGETALAIPSIFPPFHAARNVARTGDAVEDVASAAKRVDRASDSLPKNLSVHSLNDLSDPAINPSLLRENLSPYVRSGNTNNLSIAAGSVEVDGNVQHLLSVSGKGWKGNAPSTVKIDGVEYQVIRSDSGEVSSVLNGPNGSTNFNHAEQKLMSHLQETYSGNQAKVSIGVQNTSVSSPGMCSGCTITSKSFAESNPLFDVQFFEGSSGVNP